MKVQVKVAPKVIVEAEADTHVDLFEQISSLQEVFGQHKCGKCGCEKLRFVVRTDKDDNKYYELACQNFECKAKLAFGAHKKGGGLFPKRKESENQSLAGGTVEAGAYLPSNGWLRYNKQKGHAE